MTQATNPITVQELQEISGLDVLDLKRWSEGFFRWLALGMEGLNEWDDDIDEDQLDIPQSFDEVGGSDDLIRAYLRNYSRNEGFVRL